jgi:putative sugar O-methyltransferase
VFVTSLLRSREMKMATALRSVGWTVILLYKQTTPFTPDNFFDIAIQAASDDELHRTAKELQPRICHVFSGAVDELLLRFCRDKPAPVVIDLNDVFCPSLFNYLHERFEPTKECLANADGICARDLQPKFAERYDRFKIPRHVLLFAEYSWHDGPADPHAAKKRDPSEIHVVSVGTICLETQGMYDSCYLQLARMLADQRIHLHIYPHWFYRNARGTAFNFNLRKDFADFFRMERETPYLHMHESLPLHELARELPQYDFGIISGGGAEYGQRLNFLTQRYMQACYSGRISDYLDARLPVLINREIAFNYWLLERYGLAVDLAGVLRPGFHDELLAIKRDRLRAEQVERAAQALSVGAQSARLADFYQRIIGEQQPDTLRVPHWVRRAQRIPGLREPLTGFARAIELANESSRRLRRWRDELRMREKSIQETLDKFGAENASIHAMNAKLRAMLEVQLEGTRVEDEGSLSEGLQVWIEEFQAKVEKLRSQNAELQTQLGTLYATKQDQQVQIEELEARIGKLHSEIKLEGMGINEIAGLLNWPGILDDRDRNNGFTELLRQTKLCSAHRPSRPRRGKGAADDGKSTSSAWQLLNRKNLDQLLFDGYRNFKRTIALNYFTFPVQAGDPQIASLEAKLDRAEVERCWNLANSLPDDPSSNLSDQLHYRYIVLLLWNYARQLDREKYLDRLKEPIEGNPMLVPAGGQNASQDLANSLIEYYSIREGVAFERCKRVLEIGGGYGRNAYVIMELHPGIQYTMVDIPPALYVAQRYLSSVFGRRRVFPVREFAAYEEIQDELEQSSIVFLLPHQLAKMPDRRFDLTLNISSFGEMTREEIDYYFAEMQRVSRGHLYTKQWIQSKNPFDNLVLTEADYPVRPHWRKVYSRPCNVQSNFFEALYDIGGHA